MARTLIPSRAGSRRVRLDADDWPDFDAALHVAAAEFAGIAPDDMTADNTDRIIRTIRDRLVRVRTHRTRIIAQPERITANPRPRTVGSRLVREFEFSGKGK
jgi:hypothetical protein